MSKYNCSVCDFGTGNSIAMQQHAKKHKNTYRRYQGKYDAYEDVRKFFRENPGLMRTESKSNQPASEHEDQSTLTNFNE